MKTRQEVEQLRIAWVTEPWDDLETTEGYGEYFVELILFRRKMPSKLLLNYLSISNGNNDD